MFIFVFRLTIKIFKSVVLKPLLHILLLIYIIYSCTLLAYYYFIIPVPIGIRCRFLVLSTLTEEFKENSLQSLILTSLFGNMTYITYTHYNTVCFNCFSSSSECCALRYCYDINVGRCIMRSVILLLLLFKCENM